LIVNKTLKVRRTYSSVDTNMKLIIVWCRYLRLLVTEGEEKVRVYNYKNPYIDIRNTNIDTRIMHKKKKKKKKCKDTDFGLANREC
jgi:hypothetical protein